MQVLVTGGAGYIGSVTVKMLLDRGHQVFVLDNLSTGHIEAIDKRAFFNKGDLISFDISADMSNQGYFTPDAVIHFAGSALVAESMVDPLKYFRNNVGSGINLLRGMKKLGCERIIFSSSCATYGYPKDNEPISEESKQHPVNPYGESKLMFEKILKWDSELKPTILRYFNACGAVGSLGEDHSPETHLIPNVLKAAMDGTSVKVFGTSRKTKDGSCVRDYIHISDLAAAHVAVLEKHCIGTFNLGTGKGNSVKEVVEAARMVTGRHIKIEECPDRPGDPDRLIANPTLAKSTFGWEAQVTDIKDMVASAWQWHLDYPFGY
jgi:UDP-glucose 4-epimerase